MIDTRWRRLLPRAAAFALGLCLAHIARAEPAAPMTLNDWVVAHSVPLAGAAPARMVE